LCKNDISFAKLFHKPLPPNETLEQQQLFGLSCTKM